MSISKEKIIADLERTFQKFGELPTIESYNKNGMYSHSSIQKYFGSWNKALMAVFGKINLPMSHPNKPVLVNCKQCNKQFTKRYNQIKKTKNNFCSSSCAATYNNTHKTKGTRRSKLEIWLEEQLKALYPDLKPLFNEKEAINSELDIYFPTLKLAFELNGILHYEPIYGPEKLASIQNNDSRKFQACIEKGIELCIIDSSTFNKFKPAKAQKYLEMIKHIVEKKL